MNNKLIYILNHYSKDSSSHFQHVIHLLEKMAEKGIDIALIIEKCEVIPEVSSASLHIHPINTSRLNRFFRLLFILFKLNQKGFKRIFIRINWRAALIASLASFFTRQKIYFWLSSQGSRENYLQNLAGWKKWVVWWKTQFPLWLVYKFVHKWVTGPESMVKYYEELYGFDPRKMMVLYNDIDLDRFHPVDYNEKKKIRSELSLSDDHFLVLFVHRFSPVRKHSFYFPYILDRYFEDDPIDNIHFIFIGEGPEKEVLEEKINEKTYASRNKFMGAIPNVSIDTWYKAADLFIQPTFAEGFPRTTLEAMACGLPIVTTDAGGIEDVLGSIQKEFMVDKNDRDAFVSRLTALVKDQKVRMNCQEENLKEVRKYDTEQIADMYIKNLFN